MSASYATAATAISRRESFLPDCQASRYASLIVGIAGLLNTAVVSAQDIGLTIGRIETPAFSADNISGILRFGRVTTLDLTIGELSLGGKLLRNIRLTCPDVRHDQEKLACADGALELPAKVPVAFVYSSKSKSFSVSFTPANDEEWRVQSELRGSVRSFVLTVTNGSVSRFNAWLPKGTVLPRAGSITGKVAYSGETGAKANGQLTISDLAFSDPSGLHAGEKISAAVDFDAEQRRNEWSWRSHVEWKSGELFWQPLFMTGNGHTLTVAGTLDPRGVTIDRGQLALAGVGEFTIEGSIERATAKIERATLKSVNLDMAALYSNLLKPALHGTVLGNLRVAGHADIDLMLAHGEAVAADVVIKRLSIEDNERRFALFGLDGTLPWRRDELKAAKLRLEGGEVLRIPFGGFDLPLETRGIRVRTHDLRIPLLDGTLTVADFATSGEGETWRWRFTGGVTPLSMEQLTTALGVTVLHGTLAAEIPTVSYQQSTLKVDGSLLFKVFDGAVTARNLVLENPFGLVPRLTGDLDMRNLELDLVTRTFSFGTMTGRIDADVKGLELVRWQPVRFDARVASSAGAYPRRISQAAVQNISALGGAGAAAAIQRSFLGFFETFGYSQIGLSCKLDGGICEMGGIENVPQGYVIVKGGGIPSINVLGYNRKVGWDELIDRLKRVTQSNVHPIVK